MTRTGPNAHRRAVQRNRTREMLTTGVAALGCFLRYPDPGLAELLAVQGFDFLVFDGEHGTLSPSLCENLARAVELHDVTPMVRVEENRPASILRYLDAGALGCHVPGVDSREDALCAVRAIKFRPAGHRGLSASRASGFGAHGGYAEYVSRANSETQVVVHIESRAGVEAASEIAAVPGVDVLFFGALDLSHDLGRPGKVDSPEIVAAAEAVASAAAAAGKVFGAVASNAASAQIWWERGARYLVATVEALLQPPVTEFLAEGRRAIVTEGRLG